MSDDKPIEPIAKLGKRLRDEATNLGLDMKMFALTPDLDGENHGIQATFILSDEPPTDEDKTFEQIIRNQHELERQAKVEEERKQLESLRDDLKKKDKGIGLD